MKTTTIGSYPKPPYLRIPDWFLNEDNSPKDWKKAWGLLGNKKGQTYIEAHHLTPLSNLPEGKALKFNAKEDFRVLCANCHRMVHRKNPPYTIEELKAKFK